MKSKIRRCPVCERGTVVGKPASEAMPFRHAPALLPAWEVTVPTCDACGETFIDSSTAEALDKALGAALKEHERELVSSAIARLGEARTQREWEKRLGLSPGYLSRLKAGKECSVPLVTLLTILADAPEAWWQRVMRMWSSVHLETHDSPTLRRLTLLHFDARTTEGAGTAPLSLPKAVMKRTLHETVTSVEAA